MLEELVGVEQPDLGDRRLREHVEDVAPRPAEADDRDAAPRELGRERANADAPWTTVTYGEALRKVRGAAAWILAQGLSAERPLAILSDNSIDHALFALAAMHAGVPAASVSPAFSLMS